MTAATAAVPLVRVSVLRSALAPRLSVPLSLMDACPDVAPFRAPLSVAVLVPETVSVPPSVVTPAMVRLLPVPLTVTLPCKFDVPAASFSVSAPPALMLRWLFELEFRLLMLWVLLVRLTVTPETRFR